MRRSLILIAGAVIFALPIVTDSGVGAEAVMEAAQVQQPQGNRGGVQVGVPDGRGGRPAGPGRGRGRETGPPQPAPRNAQGRVLLAGATPKDKGVWSPGPVVGDPLGLAKKIPYQPWAQALAVDRRTHALEPHTRCKPSGVARVFLTPYGVEILELPELDRVYIFDIGGPHTFRTVYMDGRSHPTNRMPDYYGHSIGWWDRDTLVVDTTGFNEGFWLDRGLLPHTEKLHTIERFTRLDSRTLRYELTVDDPGAYTQPFTGAANFVWEANTELFEYMCQEANYAHNLMVGQATSVDRTTLIVP
jgi:hypothetical protein